MRIASTARMLFAGVSAAALMLPMAASAEHKMYQGRTGLPAVLDSKSKVWVERGDVTLAVRGANLNVTQTFRLRYPGGKLESKPASILVGVREDYYRSKDGGIGDIVEADAKGFEGFAVRVDGRSAPVVIEPWKINSRKDTATRWRTWTIPFTPNRVRTMSIVSTAPLGWDGGHRTVEFVAKDIGGWREVADYVEIRLKAPGRAEARLAGLEPKPDDQNAKAVRWVFRKIQPKRDIFVMLPPDYPSRRASR